jgi:hypothetical protein
MHFKVLTAKWKLDHRSICERDLSPISENSIDDGKETLSSLGCSPSLSSLIEFEQGMQGQSIKALDGAGKP